MDNRPNNVDGQGGLGAGEINPTRRSILAAGSVVALSGLAGCVAIDGVLDRSIEQLVGTTVSSPAAFYAGGPRIVVSQSDEDSDGDKPQLLGSDESTVRQVPATVQADSREIELEGWSINGTTRAQEYNSSRSNKPNTEWWVGPDDDDADNDSMDEDALIAYLDGEPTIGERFTICLPDANLRGDRGSLAEELTPGRVLAYFAPSREPDGVRAPFTDQYGNQGISYNDGGCVQIDGPVSLHKDIACQDIFSAELDTYRTANRGLVGYATDDGAVVSGAPASADKGGKNVLVVENGMTLREPERLDSWGRERTAGDVSVGETLVCPVAVTPEDSLTPLPGLFYVRRVIHDDQVIFAGGWILDEGALYEDSVTLLFDEGPTEVASVTPEDIESDDYNERIVEQFSRDRSRFGSALISGTPEAVADSGTMPGPLNGILEGDNDEQMADGGDGGVDILGMGAEKLTAAALDAPLVHLAGAKELSSGEKNDVGLLLRGIDKKDIRRRM